MGVGHILRAQLPPVHGERIPGYKTIPSNATSISLSHIPEEGTD